MSEAESNGGAKETPNPQQGPAIRSWQQADSLIETRTVTRLPSAVLIVLKGSMRHEGAKQLSSQVHAAVGGGSPSIIFDMSGVDYMNSTAIGALVNGAATIEGSGGRAVLAALQPTIEKVLITLGLFGLFRVVPTVEEAVEQLSS